MKKTTIFLEQTKMQTDTVFEPNGNISVYPCSHELGKHITTCGDRVAQKGRMVTDCNGTSRFVPYRMTGASRYVPLFSTASTIVKMSDNYVIVETRIPRRRLTPTQMCKLFKNENAEVAAYLKTDNFTKSINPQNPNAE